MKANTFKGFTQLMQTAEADNPIWWCGYIFCSDLTPKQLEKVKPILAERFGVTIDERSGLEMVLLPSGIGLLLNGGLASIKRN